MEGFFILSKFVMNPSMKDKVLADRLYTIKDKAVRLTPLGVLKLLLNKLLWLVLMLGT